MATISPYPLRAFLILCVCVSACTSSKTSGPPAAKQPMNVILFYADDLGWMDLGIQGSPYYETPHLDQLAAEGVRFTQAYANAANCAPSRACLMTGMYTPRHGIYTVSNSDRGKSINRQLIPTKNTTVLDSALLTMPQYFQQNGYQTCMAGKWHLSNDPLPYGFHTNFGGNHRGAPKSYFSPYKNPALSDGPEGEHLPDRLSTEVSQWIESKKDSPFFVYFPFYSVHTPIQAREDLTTKYQAKQAGIYHNKPEYAAMIEAMDAAVGKILAQLKELGLEDQTIILFTADNGAQDQQTLSRPLRGAKGMYYEGGIRVPFLIKWPGLTQAGTTNETPIIGSDLFPTFVDMLGGEPAAHPVDGQSILPLLSGKKMSERALYWHFPAYLQMYKKSRAFEDSHDKPFFRTAPVSVIREGDWKLLEFFEEGDLELYNLADDLGEQNNLINTHPEKAKELHQNLLDWRAETHAPVPTERNPEYQEQ
ncbi:MAG: sulfatase [Bacteroidota bacterium]